MKKITDPGLLDQLNGSDSTKQKKVTDPELLNQLEENKPMGILDSIKGIASTFRNSPQYSTSPQGSLEAIQRLMSKGSNKLGNWTAQEMGRQGNNPYLAAGVGTAMAMTPDVLMSVTPNESEAEKVSEAAVPFARRASGFSKRFLKTPMARQTADEAARVALENKVIPWSGNLEVSFDRATELQKSAAQRMNDVFQRAYRWVQSSGASKAPEAAKVGEVVDVSPDINKIGLERKALPLKTPTQGTSNVPGRRAEFGAESELEPPQESTVFEQQHKFINPKKIISSLNALRPKYRGGHWDADHDLIDKAIETVKGAGPGDLTLQDANMIKSRLQKVAPYGTEGHELAKSAAYHVRRIVDSSLDELANEIGDPKLASEFKAAKRMYGGAVRLKEGLNNQLASDAGNMFPSPVSVGVGAMRFAHGDVLGAMASLGVTELLRRRGSAVASRLINALGTSVPPGQLPGLINAILRKQREDSNP